MKTYSNDPVVSVVSNADLADWIGIDSSDPLLTDLGISATQLVIDHLQSELITRERVVIYSDWPKAGTDTSPSLSPANQYFEQDIYLPGGNLIGVNEVLIYGEAVTDFHVMGFVPGRIRIDIAVNWVDNEDAVKVTYDAGFGQIADVPSGIKLAVKLLAGYIYEHRGACDMTLAFDKSGAAQFLTPYRTNLVAL